MSRSLLPRFQFMPTRPRARFQTRREFWLRQVLAVRTIQWLIFPQFQFLSLHQNNSTQIISMLPKHKYKTKTTGKKKFPRLKKKSLKTGMDLLSNAHFRKLSAGISKQCNGRLGLTSPSGATPAHTHKHTRLPRRPWHQTRSLWWD